MYPQNTSTILKINLLTANQHLFSWQINHIRPVTTSYHTPVRRIGFNFTKGLTISVTRNSFSFLTKHPSYFEKTKKLIQP